MQRFDVAVVGGGPAGSSVARALAESDLTVCVLDKADFPRDKVCAGWITPQVVDEVDLDLDEYRSGGRTLQPIRRFRVALGEREPLSVEFDDVVSYGIRRCELDDYLLRRSGAELRLGEPVRSLERRDASWIVNDALEARLLVGAGGHFCPVAKRLAGEPEDASAVVIAQELEARLLGEQASRCAVAADTPELYFEEDLRGYGWCFRKGDYLNVGLGRLDRTRLKAHVAALRERLERAGRIPDDLGAPLKGHAYRIYGRAPRPVVGEATLLIGDAAGLAYPLSGEGIRPAIESGLLAARTVLEALAPGGEAPDQGRLAGYERALVERFGPRHAATLLPPSWKAAIGKQLFRSRRFVARVVVERWFLRRDLPALAAPTAPAASATARAASVGGSPVAVEAVRHPVR